jgi:IS1 family transposase
MLDRLIWPCYLWLAMNRLPMEKRAAVLGMLVEGNSLRATSRLADVSINTVTKLLVELSEACAEYHDLHVRNVRAQRVQCDEIWCFVGAKAKNVTPEKQARGWGDTWTWTAIDADSKLCLSYRIGGRDGAIAFEFMQDLASRLANRVQLTTDGHRVYLNAVEDAFGSEIDYAMLVKIYGHDPTDDSRYSPAECIDCKPIAITAQPDPKHISTSFVERQNLTMRMGMRRFTRLTNGFSKKVQNHTAMVAIHFMHYNFARIHKTLRLTPAMAAGVSDHVWSLEEIITMADNYLPKPAKRGPYNSKQRIA